MEDREIAAVDQTPEVGEKSLTTSQVNDIVKREKARAAESARRELEAQHREELERVRAESVTKPTDSPSDNTTDLEDRVLEKFMDKLEKHQGDLEREAHERELKSLADKYYLKMGKGSELFEDFNEVMGDFEADKFPNSVMLAANMDNTPEIMYELANNPSKLQQIEGLAQRSPKLAMKELERLSKSINANLEAKNNNVSAPAPLSRLKSSSVGVDSGKMTLRDYKNAPWLRG